MTQKRKRAAAAELDEVLDALVKAIPPERHGEMRAVLREALRSTTHRLATPRPPAPTPDDVAPEPHPEPPSHQPPPAPTPPTTRERAARIADSIIVSAATRATKAPTNSLLSLRTGPGTLGVAVRGEGKRERMEVRAHPPSPGSDGRGG